MDVFSILDLLWFRLLIMAIMVIFIFIVAFVKYTTWYFSVFDGQDVPVPVPPRAIVGTLTASDTDLTKSFIERFGNHKTIGTFLGRVPQLITIDPDILREVFIKEHACFPNRTSFPTGETINDLMLGNVQDYDQWKYLRSTISPFFTSGKLKRMIIQINKCASVYAGHLIQQGNKSIDIKEFSGSFSMDVIASTAFGLDLNTAEDRNNPFVIQAKKAFKISETNPVLLVGIFAPFLLPILRLFKVSLIDPDAIAFFKDVTDKLLDIRKDDDSRVDFLQLMKDAHKNVDGDSDVHGMTSDEILAQCVLFFLAGYDTTATTISYLAYCLAVNPEKQEILLKEIDNVTGGKENITDEDLHKMTYLEMCVAETLRLFPPASQIDRRSIKDVTVKGIKLPKGSCIMAPVFLMHRHPAIYPDPLVFDPERFTNENKAARDVMNYLPFGAGPRMCLATRLALLEVKLATVAVLKTHRFVKTIETQIPLELEFNVGLIKPKHGIWLKLEERNV